MAKKKKKGKIITALVLIISIISVSVLYAEEIKWTEDKRDEAWAVYCATEWKNVGLNVDGDGNIAYITDELTKSAEGYWLSCMNYFYDMVKDDMQVPDIDNPEDPSAYKSLILAMCGALGDCYDVDYEFILSTHHNLSEMGKNIARLSDYSENRLNFRLWETVDGDVYNDNYQNNDNKEGTASAILYMYNNFIAAQKAYKETYGEDVSIYKKNDALMLCVQAALYGPEYVKYTNEYSSFNANKYWRVDNNTELPDVLYVDFKKFANKTFDFYNAVSANGHSVQG